MSSEVKHPLFSSETKSELGDGVIREDKDRLKPDLYLEVNQEKWRRRRME